MADAQANLNLNIDTSSAIGEIKALQSQISQLYASMATGGAKARAEASNLTQNLLNSVNATGKFSASMVKLSSSADYFTNALEKNKLSMGEYFRFGAASTKTFGRLFTSEFNTIEKVARERVKTLQTQYIKMGRDANGAIQGIAVRPLTLDMNNLGTQVMMTAQKQQIFNQLLKQGTTNLLNFGKNTQWAGRQLMVGFTIPLTILGTTAAKTFMEIEEQVIRFRRVYGEFDTTAQEADVMAKKLRELAGEFTKYGVAVKDTLAMAADAAAMGKMGNDLLGQVEQAARLAVLGGVEQEKALETTISLTNAFGTATEDLSGKIAFLNAVENQTVVSIEDLTTAIPKAGPVVRQLGGDVEDLAFFLTAMKEGGINASEGANALKSGLASLINPTEKAKNMLADLGINITGIVESNAGDVKGTVIQFAQALDQLDPLNRARAIEELFGKFQFARISTLFQNVIAQGNQASRVLDLTANTTEELAILAERELSRVEESTGYKFKKAIEDVQAALAPVGEEFLKAITPFIGIATDILKWFNNLGDGAKQFGVIAVAAIGVVAPTFLMLFGLVANGFANFIKGVSKVGAFLGLLSGQTKMVGGGFNYLTQEQIEAQGIAASLEQVHQRLHQALTTEAGAVDQLAAAYRRAAPALRDFNTASGGAGAGGTPRPGTGRYNPFLPPKKYADGVTMVPGPKGKGDIVPAMLTPGEAVIPADQTAKYFPLIKGIVADNLPGYEYSNVDDLSMAREKMGSVASRIATTEGAAPKIAQKLFEEAEKRARDFGTTVTDAAGQLESAFARVSDGAVKNATALQNESEEFRAIKRERVDAQGDVFAHIGPPESMTASQAASYLPEDANSAAARDIRDISTVLPDKNLNLTSRYGMETSRRLNLDLANQGARKDELVADMESRGAAKWEEAYTAGGVDVSTEDAQAFIAEQDRRLIEKISQSRAEFVLDTNEQLEDIAESERGRYVSLEQMEADVFDDMQSDMSIPQSQRDLQAEGRETALARRKQVRTSKFTNAEAQAIYAASQDASDPEKQAAAQRLAGTLSIVPGESGTGEYQAGKKKRNIEQGLRGATEEAFIQPAQDGTDDGTAYGTSFVEAVEASGEDGYDANRSELRQSPHPLSGEDGFDDGSNYGTKFQEGVESAGRDGYEVPRPPSRPGELPLPGAPEPPSVADAAPKQSKFGAFFGSAKDKVLGAIAKPLARAAGNNLVDNEGNVIYEADQDPESWAYQMRVERELEEARVEAARAAEQQAIATENATDAVQENTTATATATNTEGLVPSPDGSGTMVSPAEAKKIDRTVKSEAKKQARQRRASAAAGILGTASIAAGIGTQIEGPIGEFATKLLPVVGGLAAIAPILLALPLPLAALVAIVGAGIWAYTAYNKMIDEARERGYGLVNALSASEKALNTFAEFAGTVSSQEILGARLENLGRPMTKVAGETTFGESFLESEGGADLLNSIQESIRFIGSGQAADMLYSQMASAVISGVFSEEQARSVVAAIGDEVGDYSFSMGINSRLLELLGPDGEDLLKDPLRLQAVIEEVTAGSAEAAAEAIVAAAVPMTASDPEVIDRYVQDTMEKRRTEGFDLFVGDTQQNARNQLIDYFASFGQDEEQANRFRQIITNPQDIPRDELQGIIDAFAQQTGYTVTEATASLAVNTEQSLAIQERALRAAGEAGTLPQFGLDQTARVLTAENIGKSIAALENFYATAQTGIAALTLTADENVASAEEALDAAKETGDQEKINQAQADLDKAREDRAKALQENAERNAALREAARENLLNTDEATGGIPVDKRREGFEDQDVRITANLEGQQKRDMETLLSMLSATDDENYEYNFILRGMLEDGDMSAATMLTLLNKLGPEGDADLGRVVADLSFEVGEDYAASFQRILTGIENPEVIMDILAHTDDFEGSPEELIDYIESLAADVSLASIFGTDTDARKEFEDYLSSPEAQEKRQQYSEDVSALRGSEYQREDFVAAGYTEAEADAIVTQIDVDREKFDEFSEDTKQDFVTDLLVVVDVDDKTGIWAFLQNKYLGTDIAGEDGILDRGAEQEAADADTLYGYYEGMADISAGDQGDNEFDNGDKGGSGGPSGSWLDPIVKASRDFGDANQELTTGFEESLDAILNMVDGVAWATNGLASQLRNTDIPETLIEKFLGMEPEEWEKTKKELFDDIDGQLVLNEKGRKVMDAYDSSTIANKTEETKSETRATIDQVQAYRDLTRAGYSTAEAFDIIQDKEVAGAIARKGMTAETIQLIKAQQELNKAQEEYEEISEEQRIADAVKEMNKDFNEQIKAVQRLTKEQKKYTDAQIDAILNNKDLMKLFLKPSISPKALKEALDNANRKAELELMVKRLTFEGREDLFNQGISDAMNAFGALEQELDIKFNAKVKDDSDLVKTAEEQLGLIDFELSQYQAGITEIGFTEDLINKTYDKRLEALDKVNELNQQIEQSQKNQLDLADALSKGDIAAAAKAAQEMRSTQQQDAIDTQRRMLETARETELAAITSTSGMTKEQLEERVKLLEQERFSIEQNSLAPAQERIRLAELERDKRIEELRVLGKTREEWEIIQNEVAVAAAHGWRLVDSVTQAMDIMQQVIDDLLNRPKVTPSKVKGGGGGGGSSSKKSSSNSAPAPSAPRPSGGTSNYVSALSSLGVNPNPASAKANETLSRTSWGWSPFSGGGIARYANGGIFMGSDIVPAMLTPGEFIVRRPAVSAFGVKNLEDINRGTYSGNSMYNYNLNVNVKSDANPEQIANTVMRSIKQVEGRRIRSTNYNG